MGYIHSRSTGNVTGKVPGKVPARLPNIIAGGTGPLRKELGVLTIKDVAAYCGVSVSTVSRVLNHRPDVSPAVRELVNEAIAACNYIPNNSARSLVASRSTAIGVVVRGVDNPFLSSIIRTLGKEIHRRGYTMVLNQITVHEDEVRAAAVLQREKKLLGVIFVGGRFNYTEEELRQLDVPFVCCTYTNTFGNLREDAYSSVSIRDEEEAAKAVRFLYENGHRRIAILVDDPEDSSIGQLRWQGYRKALEELSLPYDSQLAEFTGSYDMKDAYRGVCHLLERGAGFTALLSISDTMAIAAIKALVDHGRRVPEDCSVISIDGLELSCYTVPTLTTLCQPAGEMARESVEMITALIEGSGEHRHLLLQTTLQRGGSVAPPPALTE